MAWNDPPSFNYDQLSNSSSAPSRRFRYQSKPTASQQYQQPPINSNTHASGGLNSMYESSSQADQFYNQRQSGQQYQQNPPTGAPESNSIFDRRNGNISINSGGPPNQDYKLNGSSPTYPIPNSDFGYSPSNGSYAKDFMNSANQFQAPPSQLPQAQAPFAMGK